MFAPVTDPSSSEINLLQHRVPVPVQGPLEMVHHIIAPRDLVTLATPIPGAHTQTAISSLPSAQRNNASAETQNHRSWIKTRPTQIDEEGKGVVNAKLAVRRKARMAKRVKKVLMVKIRNHDRSPPADHRASMSLTSWT